MFYERNHAGSSATLLHRKKRKIRMTQRQKTRQETVHENTPPPPIYNRKYFK